MSRPDRKWRPSDADRERYATAVSQAFAEGRIDAADMESRTALIYEAKSIADLDALVEDMPAPAPAPVPQVGTGSRAGSWIRLAFGLVVLALLVGFLVVTFRDDGPTTAGASGDDLSVVDPPEPEAPPPPDDAPPPAPDLEELPEIAIEKLGLFELAGLQEMWAALPAAGHTDIESMTLFPDRASLVVRADSAHRALARFDYEGGLAAPAEPYRDLGDYETDDETYFSLSDVTPEAVMAAIAGFPAATGLPDVTVAHISIDEDADGGVTINVYPDGDTGVGYVKFDATGTQVIRVY